MKDGCRKIADSETYHPKKKKTFLFQIKYNPIKAYF
jgi:hypothetical protein